jgi:deoxyribonuclease IV
MKYIGAHVSSAGGVYHAPGRAREIGADAFALFTKNQKQWAAKPFTPDDMEMFTKNLQESGIQPKHVLPHDSYLINLANPDKEKRERSVTAFIDEAKRAEALGLMYLNFHPGAHLGAMGESEALQLIAEGVDRACEDVERIVFVVETTAGQGSSVGYRFEHLRDLIGVTAYPDRVGVCVDTCHIFAAGYDIRTEEAYVSTMEHFHDVIGFSKLRGVHCNDAKSDFGSRVDRHAMLGKGNIGWETFRLLMGDDRMDDIPIILETPDPERWAEEIQQLKGVADGM